MIEIEITNTETDNITGVSAKGKPYDFYTQVAYLHQPSKTYPTEFKVTLDKSTPFPVGFYSLSDEQSSYVDGFGKLTVRPVLERVEGKRK